MATPGQLSVMVGGVQVTGLQDEKLDGTLAITGLCASVTVTVNEQSMKFPEGSVARNVFTVVPMGNSAPLANPLIWVTVTEQMSDAVGAL